tara:strand:- start:28 stop:1893 length:1866 start_codon:yes stop_codon:yes gene_type:complete
MLSDENMLPSLYALARRTTGTKKASGGRDSTMDVLVIHSIFRRLVSVWSRTMSHPSKTSPCPSFLTLFGSILFYSASGSEKLEDSKTVEEMKTTIATSTPSSPTTAPTTTTTTTTTGASTDAATGATTAQQQHYGVMVNFIELFSDSLRESTDAQVRSGSLLCLIDIFALINQERDLEEGKNEKAGETCEGDRERSDHRMARRLHAERWYVPFLENTVAILSGKGSVRKQRNDGYGERERYGDRDREGDRDGDIDRRGDRDGEEKQERERTTETKSGRKDQGRNQEEKEKGAGKEKEKEKDKEKKEEKKKGKADTEENLLEIEDELPTVEESERYVSVEEREKSKEHELLLVLMFTNEALRSVADSWPLSVHMSKPIDSTKKKREMQKQKQKKHKKKEGGVDDGEEVIGESEGVGKVWSKYEKDLEMQFFEIVIHMLFVEFKVRLEDYPVKQASLDVLGVSAALLEGLLSLLSNCLSQFELAEESGDSSLPGWREWVGRNHESLLRVNVKIGGIISVVLEYIAFCKGARDMESYLSICESWEVYLSIEQLCFRILGKWLSEESDMTREHANSLMDSLDYIIERCEKEHNLERSGCDPLAWKEKSRELREINEEEESLRWSK